MGNLISHIFERFRQVFFDMKFCRENDARNFKAQGKEALRRRLEELHRLSMLLALIGSRRAVCSFLSQRKILDNSISSIHYRKPYWYYVDGLIHLINSWGNAVDTVCYSMEENQNEKTRRRAICCSLLIYSNARFVPPAWSRETYRLLVCESQIQVLSLPNHPKPTL